MGGGPCDFGRADCAGAGVRGAAWQVQPVDLSYVLRADAEGIGEWS